VLLLVVTVWPANTPLLLALWDALTATLVNTVLPLARLFAPSAKRLAPILLF